MGRRRHVLALLLLAFLATACGRATPSDEAAGATAAVAPADTTPATVVEAPAPETPETTAAPATTAPPPPPTTALPPPPPPPPRPVFEQAWTPYAMAHDLVLHHPAARIETVAFHQANHDGARQQDPLQGAANPRQLESRGGRETGMRTAADVVVDPTVEIRSVVTGTVLRAGAYVLYCDNHDEFAVVEPDGRPGWEVKLLHMVGVRVRPGDRVVAGETVIADRANLLPFESQVDEGTSEPAWPHVHVEVVDTSIPDRPSPGGGC